MPSFKKHAPNDWCHICGHRNLFSVDVWYPKNAEHATPDQHFAQIGEHTQYIRICSICATTMLQMMMLSPVHR